MASKSNRWMRLDLDFYSDPKVRALRKRHGEAYVSRWLTLTCLAYREHGRLDLGNEIVRDWVEAESGLKGKKLEDTVEAIAEVGLIEAQAWDEYRIMTSARMTDEAVTIDGRSSRAKAAADARWSQEEKADAVPS